MKKILLYICVAVVAMACAKSETDTTVVANESNLPTVVYASIEGQTRTELHWENGAPKAYWSVGDKIAIYNKDHKMSYGYQLAGNPQTPSRGGEFELVENSGVKSSWSDDDEFDCNFAYYPYLPYDHALRLEKDEGRRIFLVESQNVAYALDLRRRSHRPFSRT